MNAINLAERRHHRHIYPLLAEPGKKVQCLSDGASGTILEIWEIRGQLAYRVQTDVGIVREVLATALDTIS